MHDSTLPVKRSQQTTKPTEIKKRALWACAQALLLAVGAVIGFGGTRVYDSLTPDTYEPVGNRSSTPDSNERVESRSLLLFIGDSLTERGEKSDQSGWITLTRSEYSRSADILSRGYGGYNSRWTLEYVLPLIEQDLDVVPSPALITVWLGANDAAIVDGKSSLQHVPVDEYSTNLLAIVERLRVKAPAANLVLITPPPVDDDRRRSLNDGKLDRSNEQAGIYAAACIARAEQANVTVLDLYSFFNSMAEDERNACLVDGLHLNAKGNQLMQQQLVATVKDAFSDLAAALATPQLPEWRMLLNETASRR